MASEDRTYKLGATAPMLETISEFLATDRKDIQSDIDFITATIGTLTGAVERLQNRVNEMDEVALDLLTTTIEANRNTIVRNVTEEQAA